VTAVVSQTGHGRSASISVPFVRKLEHLKEKQLMMGRFDEENTSGAPLSIRDRDGESAASSAE